MTLEGSVAIYLSPMQKKKETLLHPTFLLAHCSISTKI